LTDLHKSHTRAEINSSSWKMGYCWPCTTLNGGVYFAASAHICVGLMMMSYLIYHHLQSIAHYYSSGVATSTSSDGIFTLCFIYSLVILILGLCIFYGVEKRSTRLLKTSAISFGMLHGIIFLRVIYVILLELVPALSSADPTSNFSKDGNTSSFGIVFFTFLFFTTVIYLAILTIYIKDLQMANSSGNLFSQIQLGVGGSEGNPLYAYNNVQCHA